MRQQPDTSDFVLSHAVNAVLGAMLIDNLALQDGLAALRAEDFGLDSDQRIFRSMSRLATASRHVDQLSVMNELSARGELDAIGGLDYLLDLGRSIPRNPDIQGHIRIVRDRADGQRMMRQLQEAMQRIAARSDTAAEIQDSLLSGLAAARSDDSKSARQVLPRMLTSLTPESNVRIKTGISELDEMTRGGGRPKELWIIGAQPSFGKSALCRQFERSAVSQGYGIHAHSIEVDDVTWLGFHAAQIANVQPWKLREPELLTEDDRRKLTNASLQMDHGWNYRLDDAGSVHIDTLLAKSRLSVMRHGTRVITVDYLQMLSGSERNRAELMGSIARRLKQFAKDFDCWVILLSQMSRSGDPSARPHVQQLKESGDLEAAADVILLPHRPKGAGNKYTGKDELIIGKHRNGAIGTLNVFFNSSTLCYEHDASPRDEEESSSVPRPHVVRAARAVR